MAARENRRYDTMPWPRTRRHTRRHTPASYPCVTPLCHTPASYPGAPRDVAKHEGSTTLSYTTCNTGPASLGRRGLSVFHVVASHAYFTNDNTEEGPSPSGDPYRPRGVMPASYRRHTRRHALEGGGNGLGGSAAAALLIYDCGLPEQVLDDTPPASYPGVIPRRQVQRQPLVSYPLL